MINVFAATHGRINDSNLHIILLCALGVYCLVKVCAKKFLPNADDKKREAIAFGVAGALLVVASLVYIVNR